MRAGSALRVVRTGEGAGPPAATARPPTGWLPAGRGLAIPDDPHSRRVALLKRVLPAVGVALLLLIMVWPRLAPLWERMGFAFPAIDLRDARELRMVNPRYAGTDRVGRPYLVTAAVGRQVPDRQDLMSLEAPRADMQTHGGADVVISAATGVYQSQAQLLDLFGDVLLTRQDGTRFTTEAARVNTAANTAEGSDPVEGHGPSGDVKAMGFRILDKGDTIVFTGRSDMLLRGAKAVAEKSAAPAGLPAPVAIAAARAEAEAKPILAAAAPKPPPRRAAPAHPVSRVSAPAKKAPTRKKS